MLLYLRERQHVHDPFWCEPYGIRVPGQVPDQLDGTGTSLAPNFHRFACSSYIFQQLWVAEHINGGAVVEEDPLLRDSSLTDVQVSLYFGFFVVGVNRVYIQYIAVVLSAGIIIGVFIVRTVEQAFLLRIPLPQ